MTNHTDPANPTDRPDPVDPYLDDIRDRLYTTREEVLELFPEVMRALGKEDSLGHRLQEEITACNRLAVESLKALAEGDLETYAYTAALNASHHEKSNRLDKDYETARNEREQLYRKMQSKAHHTERLRGALGQTKSEEGA